MRHLDVIRLVKPRTKLDKHHDFLSIFCCFHQRIDDLASLCHTIQRHFNGNDTVILCCLLKHLQKRLHALKRIRQQHILFLDLCQNAFLIVKARAELRATLWIEKFCLFPQVILQCKDKGQIKRCLHIDNVIHANLQKLGQFLFCFVINFAAQFYSYRI